MNLHSDRQKEQAKEADRLGPNGEVAGKDDERQSFAVDAPPG